MGTQRVKENTMHRNRSSSAATSRVRIAACAIALVAAPLLLLRAHAQEGATGALDRARGQGRLTIGYRTDAPPFSHTDESGKAAGYSVALCQQIADAAKGEPGLAGMRVAWVPVTVGDRFRDVQQRRIDLLCGAETVTVARRAEVSFSIPIFPGGIGALVRADASARLRETLSGRGQAYRPTWRASVSQVLRARAFSAVEGTTSDKWLTERIRDLAVTADISRVDGYGAGVRSVLERRSDAFFGERAVLLDAAKRHASARDLIVIDRLFTYEPLALALGRGDEDFRLLVDRVLSRLYESGGIGGLYTEWFGEPDEATLTFFRWNALPQ
jgi:putrescine:ornithine antiporter